MFYLDFRDKSMSVTNYFNIIKSNLRNSNILNYAAQLSYGLSLAFLPILLLFNFAIQFLSHSSEIQTEIFNFISENLPKNVADLILPTLINNNYNPLNNINSIITNITLIFFLVYASARLIRVFILITANINGYRIRKNFLVLWLIAFRDLFLIIIYLITVLGIYLEFHYLIDNKMVLPIPGLSKFKNPILNYISVLYIFLMLFLLLNWCLSKLPDRKIKFKNTLPGAIFIVIGWFLLILFYKLINGFLNYGGIIVLVSQGLSILITIYLISLVTILGIFINRIFYEIKKYKKNYVGAKKYA